MIPKIVITAFAQRRTTIPETFARAFHLLIRPAWSVWLARSRRGRWGWRGLLRSLLIFLLLLPLLPTAPHQEGHRGHDDHDDYDWDSVVDQGIQRRGRRRGASAASASATASAAPAALRRNDGDRRVLVERRGVIVRVPDRVGVVLHLRVHVGRGEGRVGSILGHGCGSVPEGPGDVHHLALVIRHGHV